jgi:hypothetical protein
MSSKSWEGLVDAGGIAVPIIDRTPAKRRRTERQMWGVEEDFTEEQCHPKNLLAGLPGSGHAVTGLPGFALL